MKFELIETPAKATREQRFNLAIKADYCIKWIKAQGLEVVSVDDGFVGPRITIRSSELCELFEDVIFSYERGLQSEHRYGYVLRHGCEIRWVIGGAQ
jgi:hypothetical protein